MNLTVYSPYDGQPVSWRSQDVGRAMRDSQGRIFYVLPTQDGQGHYASRTRHGSAREQELYRQQLGQQGQAILDDSDGSPVPSGPTQGMPRRAIWALVLAAVLALGIAVVAWMAMMQA